MNFNASNQTTNSRCTRAIAVSKFDFCLTTVAVDIANDRFRNPNNWLFCARVIVVILDSKPQESKLTCVHRSKKKRECECVSTDDFLLLHSVDMFVWLQFEWQSESLFRMNGTSHRSHAEESKTNVDKFPWNDFVDSLEIFSISFSFLFTTQNCAKVEFSNWRQLISSTFSSLDQSTRKK